MITLMKKKQLSLFLAIIMLLGVLSPIAAAAYEELEPPVITIAINDEAEKTAEEIYVTDETADAAEDFEIEVLEAPLSDFTAIQAASAGTLDYLNLSMTVGATVNEMRFTWQTQTVGSSTGSIAIREAGAVEWQQVQNAITMTRPGAIGFSVHHVTFMGLKAATDYEYEVRGDDGQVSEVKAFRTGAAANQGFQFAIAGDIQTGMAGLDYERTGWTNTMDVAVASHPNLEFLLALGDQVSTTTGSDLAAFNSSQNKYNVTFAPIQLHNIPMAPIVGNHDTNAGNANMTLWHSHYNTPHEAENQRQFATATENQFDYWFRWGNVFFIVLNMNTSTGNVDRLAFLEQALAQNADAQWKVATFHQPPYSVYRNTTDGTKQNIINNWIPHFERLGFDAVLAGHCHSYSRSFQMIANQPQRDQQYLDGNGNIQSDPTGLLYNAVLDPTGIVYMAFNSPSGSGYYNVNNMPRNYIASFNQNFRRNFSVADVTNDKFTITTYQVNADSSTTVVDVYTIVRSDANGNVPASVGTLPQMGDNNDDNLVRVYAIDAITGLQSGTPKTAEALGLPQTVRIDTTLRNNTGLGVNNIDVNIRNPAQQFGRDVMPLYAEVVWDVASAQYDPSSQNAQSFTVTGQITLPRGVTNAGAVSTQPTVQVSVFGIENLASISAPAPVTGVPNGTALNNIALPATVQVITELGSTRAAAVAWDLNSASPAYNPALATTQAFTLTGLVTLPADLPNANDVPLTVTIQVTVVEFTETIYISELGSRYRFFGRTNSAFLNDAFDPAIFATWPGGGTHPDGHATPIGFGAPRSGSGLTLNHTIPVGADSDQRGTGSLHTFTYFSRTFEMPANYDPANIVSVYGEHHLDDNMVMYINGVEVYRANTATNASGNIRIGQGVNWGAYVGQNTDAQRRWFDINEDVNHRDMGVACQANDAVTMHDAASRTNLVQTLKPGVNVLTVAVGNNSSGSSDLWFNLELIVELGGADARHAVTFDSDGGSEIPAAHVTDGNPVSQPANPIKAGYQFTGWFLGGAEYDFSTPVTAPITLIARWIPVQTHTVSAFGESYWLHPYRGGAAINSLPADMFDASSTSGWTFAPTPVGFGTAAESLTLATNPGRVEPLDHWTFMKKTFELPADFDAANILDVSGRHRIDDALVIFVNGVEVYRFNTTPDGTNVNMTNAINWGVYPGHNLNARTLPFDINSDYSSRDVVESNVAGQGMLNDAASRTALESALRPGENVISIAIGQRGSASSDLWFDLELNITLEIKENTSPTLPLTANIRAEAATASLGETVDYVVYLENAVDVQQVNLTFTVDGTKLYGSEFIPQGRFGFTPGSGNSVTWMQLGGDIWQGSVRLSVTGDPLTAVSADIIRLSFMTLELGDAVVTIESVRVIGWNGDNASTNLGAEIEDGQATTLVVEWFSRFDINRDGVVDDLDLIYILRLFGATRENTAEWNAPTGLNDSRGNPVTFATVDVNGDGAVDMLDILELLANYG